MRHQCAHWTDLEATRLPFFLPPTTLLQNKRTGYTRALGIPKYTLPPRQDVKLLKKMHYHRTYINLRIFVQNPEKSV
jgi:hypothetical protein